MERAELREQVRTLDTPWFVEDPDLMNAQWHEWRRMVLDLIYKEEVA